MDPDDLSDNEANDEVQDISARADAILEGILNPAPPQPQPIPQRYQPAPASPAAAILQNMAARNPQPGQVVANPAYSISQNQDDLIWQETSMSSLFSKLDVAKRNLDENPQNPALETIYSAWRAVFEDHLQQLQTTAMTALRVNDNLPMHAPILTLVDTLRTRFIASHPPPTSAPVNQPRAQPTTNQLNPEITKIPPILW